MARTYLQLKNSALILTDHEGAIDVGSVAEIALIESLQYVAQMVQLDTLIGEADYTLTASDITNETIALGSGGFEVTDMTEPLELWVDTLASDGSRYDYKRYRNWRRLRNTSRGGTPLFGQHSTQQLANRTFSLSTDRVNILIQPFPSEGKQCTLFYQQAPADYTDAGYPELTSPWDSILINGAVLYINEFLSEGGENLNPYLLFKQLNPQIEELKIALDSPRSSPQLRIHQSYSPRLS